MDGNYYQFPGSIAHTNKCLNPKVGRLGVSLTTFWISTIPERSQLRDKVFLKETHYNGNRFTLHLSSWNKNSNQLPGLD